MHYKAFEKEGVRIVAGFDINPIKINQKARLPILHMEQLESVVREHQIKTAILAVPAISAQEVCDRLQDAGIQGIMNFAPRRLKVRPDIVVAVDSYGLIATPGRAFFSFSGSIPCLLAGSISSLVGHHPCHILKQRSLKSFIMISRLGMSTSVRAEEKKTPAAIDTAMGISI